MLKVLPSFSSDVKETWMKKFQKLFSAMTRTSNMTRSQRMTAPWFILRGKHVSARKMFSKPIKMSRTQRLSLSLSHSGKILHGGPKSTEQGGTHGYSYSLHTPSLS